MKISHSKVKLVTLKLSPRNYYCDFGEIDSICIWNALAVSFRSNGIIHTAMDQNNKWNSSIWCFIWREVEQTKIPNEKKTEHNNKNKIKVLLVSRAKNATGNWCRSRFCISINVLCTIHWELVLDCGWKCSSLSHYPSATAGERLLLCTVLSEWKYVRYQVKSLTHPENQPLHDSLCDFTQLAISNTTTQRHTIRLKTKTQREHYGMRKWTKKLWRCDWIEEKHTIKRTKSTEQVNREKWEKKRAKPEKNRKSFINKKKKNKQMRHGMTVVISQFMNQTKHSISLVYLYIDVNATVTEITMHDWTNEENAKS